MNAPTASSSVGSTARPHTRGTRNLGSGTRLEKATPKPGDFRVVNTIVGGKLVTFTLAVHAPFPDGLVLIARETKRHIKRGNVLVRSRQLAEKYKVDALYIVFQGLCDARRAFGTHARDSYVAESALLRTLTVDTIPAAMCRTWELAGATNAQKRVWTRQISALAKELKYDHAPEKSKARKKLISASDLDDTLGRNNPSAARSKLMAALSATRDRRQKVPLLDVHCAKVAAQLESIDMSAMFMVFNLELEVGRVTLRVLEAAEGKEVDLEALARCMDTEASHFGSKDVDPYGTHSFSHLERDARIVANALRQGRLNKALKRLDVMRRSLLLLKRHETVENVLTFVSRLKHRKQEFTAVYRKMAADVIEEVRNFLSTHQDIDVGFRRKVAGNMRHELARAQVAVEAKDVAIAYDALSSAARCF